MAINSGVSKKELKSLTERVIKLLDSEIDEIWFLCGWRKEDVCKGFKALGEGDLRQIRAGFDSAKTKLDDLLFTASLTKFKRKLVRAESGVHFKR